MRVVSYAKYNMFQKQASVQSTKWIEDVTQEHCETNTIVRISLVKEDIKNMDIA
jgi:hypothetical protein